jgi:hypothetical protein
MGAGYRPISFGADLNFVFQESRTFHGLTAMGAGMYVDKTLFAQIMEFVPWTSFAHVVHGHDGNSGVRTLSCAEQFRAMAFAQLTWRESLRDIETSLSANAMGFRSAIKRSTLADAQRIAQMAH